MNLTYPVSANNALFSGGSRPSDKGGAGGGAEGGHPDPEIRGPGFQKNYFRPLGLSLI